MKNIPCQFEDVKGISNELPRKSNTQSEWNEGHLTSLFGYHWREVSPVPLFAVSTLYRGAGRPCGWAMSKLGMGFGESYHPNVNDFASYKWFLLYYFFQVLVYVLMYSP